MNCVHPLRLFPTGYLTEKGAIEFFFDQYQSSVIPLSSLHRWQSDRKWFRPLVDYIEIPCGKCSGCASDRSLVWSFRCACEAIDYKPERIWFFTLTYNDENLPQDLLPQKKDLSLFLKRLRQFIGSSSPLRFFAVGELGEQTNRPHIHLILFGLDGFKLDKFPYDQKQFVFPDIERLWKKGFALGEPCNDASGCAGYVTKYMLKGDGHFVWRHSSTRPGLGYKYLEKVALSLDPNNPQPVCVGTGKGKVLVNGVPKSLRQRLKFSSNFHMEAYYLRLFNEMKSAGYTDEDARTYAVVESYREAVAALHDRQKAFKSNH